MNRPPHHCEAVQQNTTSQPIDLNPERIMNCTPLLAALCGLLIAIPTKAVAQGLKTLEASDAVSKPEAPRFGRPALEATVKEYTEWTILI